MDKNNIDNDDNVKQLKSSKSRKIQKVKSDRKVPPWGRKEAAVSAGIGDSGDAVASADDDAVWGPVGIGDADTFAPDVPIGTNQPTIAQGVLEGGMPNWPRMARGRLQTQKGKYRNQNMVY